MAKDCPDGSGNETGANCVCTDKMGAMSFGTARSARGPVFGLHSYATWNSKAYFDNVQVSNFKSAITTCGAK